MNSTMNNTMNNTMGTSEKRRYMVVNCEVCDTRKVAESLFDEVEQLVINAEVLLVSDRSRTLLNRSQAVLNVETTLDLSEDIKVTTYDGDYVMAAGECQDDGIERALIVNGNIVIENGTEKILRQYELIFANGNVIYPKDMTAYVHNVRASGGMKGVPNGTVILKENAILDKYFQMRAKQNAFYYAEDAVVMMKPDLSVHILCDKNVQFITPKVLIAENYTEEALPLFSETTEICEVPQGCAYLSDDRVLDSVLVDQYGKKVYIQGDLTIRADSTPYLQSMEYIQVSGTVSLLKSQLDIWKEKLFQCNDIEIVKGRTIKNKIKVILTKEMLDFSPDGLSLKNITKVIVDENVSPEEILNKVDLKNCTKICCNQAQNSAIELVSKNVTKIEVLDAKENDENAKESTKLPEMLDENTGNSKGSKVKTVINAEYYVL